MNIRNIHHVTAIAGNAQRNLDFYVGFLGLRLVKKTVNFDDPYTYHLYYGDGFGRPGTLLTFFPWEGMRNGQRGAGQVATVSLSIPETSLGFWLGRLAAHNLEGITGERFGEPFLAFEDPDGLSLELIAHAEANHHRPWDDGPVGAEHAVRGTHSVTLWEDEVAATGLLLRRRFGYRRFGEENGVHRYVLDNKEPGARVDIRRAEGFWPGVLGVGTVHHVAFRAEDDVIQQRLRDQVVEDELSPTPVIDRQYFRSV